MKQILVMMAAVMVGCGKKDLPEPQVKTPETPKADVSETTAPKVQPKEEAKNPQPPKATSEKLIADPIIETAIRKSLKKPEGKLTEAGVAELKKALPKCDIHSNPTK